MRFTCVLPLCPLHTLLRLHENPRPRVRHPWHHHGLVSACRRPRGDRAGARRRTGSGDQLCQRRADLGVVCRTLGQSGGTSQDPALARPRGCTAAVPPARRPATMALGPALPARVFAGAQPRQHAGTDPPRSLQPRHADRLTARTRSRIPPSGKRHPASLSDRSRIQGRTAGHATDAEPGHADPFSGRR